MVGEVRLVPPALLVPTRLAPASRNALHVILDIPRKEESPLVQSALSVPTATRRGQIALAVLRVPTTIFSDKHLAPLVPRIATAIKPEHFTVRLVLMAQLSTERKPRVP